MKSAVTFEHIALILVVTITGAFMHDLSDNCCQSTSAVCDSPPVGVVRSSASCALVPYDEKTPIVADFYRDERRLQFAEFTVTINQNWRQIGVAAVVWDAVSF